MKFSFRQILASTAGAVIAAVIASIFGVKGTIVGVAIGSAAATMGTALVAQSIERGQQAVKQVVVRAPDPPTLLRRRGATGASGNAASVDTAAATTGAMARSGTDAETVQMESAAGSQHETERPQVPAVADDAATERIRPSHVPVQPVGTARSRSPRRFSWSAIAGAAAIVFVLALMFITAIELISGKPLSAIFGNAGSGTSVNNLFTPSPTPSPAPTTTTTSTRSTSSTTTSTSTTTTSTTAVTGTSTTTTSPGTSTTTTTPGSSAVSGASTTTTAPGPSVP